MKINGTSLTVDKPIVERAREIIAKSGMPFSVTKLVSKLLGEAFDAIESTRAAIDFPLINQMRQSIHSGQPVTKFMGDGVMLIGAGMSANSGLSVTDIENIVDRVLAKREEEHTARVAEPQGHYGRSLPPSGEFQKDRWQMPEPPPLKPSTKAAPRPPQVSPKKTKGKNPATG